MYRRFVVPRVIRKSKKIITVSHFEKNRIREFFGWPEDDSRLATVYNGVSEHFKVIDDEVELKRVKDKYRLPDKYFFHLGNTDPKKNTIGVLEAYSNYIKESEEKIPLLMLDFDRQELNKMLASIGNKKLMDHIQLTGYIVNTDLPAIYNMCEIFLYPSLRESFGIPMLEAMRCGTPVITSNTSSMPEVSGGAAMIVDPFQPIQITEAIFTLLNDQATKERIVKEGFLQATKFSWKAMAENVLNLYEEVIELTKKQ